MTEQQSKLFWFIYDNPYVCYGCIANHFNWWLESATRRANSLWQLKKVFDKHKNEKCSICGSVLRFTFVVKDNVREEIEQREKAQEEE